MSKRINSNAKVFIFIPSLLGGGAERVSVNLANCMAEMGIVVTLIVATRHGKYWEQINPEVKVIRLQNRFAVFSLMPLLRLIREQKPDVVLSTLKAANVLVSMLRAFFLKNIRVAIREAGVFQQPNDIAAWIYFFLQKVFYRHADVFIVNSSDTLNSFLFSGITLPQNKVVLANPVYNQSLLEQAKVPIDHLWFKNKTTPIVAGIGRFVRYKGFDILINAVGILKSRGMTIRCILLGEGPEFENLKAMTRELRIENSIDFLGFDINPYRWLSRVDILVLPSRVESFGNVMIEALALDIPVVAANCPGGVAEVLNYGEWGSLFKTEDAEELANALVRQLSFKEARKNSKTRAYDFEIHAVTNMYLDALLPR
jgi:glycosyltransferase involved in cell wall biosynthesis